MNKRYSYSVIGRDGTGKQFEVVGRVTCEYADLWETVNNAATDQIMPKYSACPISIEQVTIKHVPIVKPK